MKQVTGSIYCRARVGFCEADDFGHGLMFVTAGPLDAPDYMPHGSVRLHCTGKPNPTQSCGHRDYGVCMPLGTNHDGPETASTVTHWN